jgi:hypothetical protein
MTSNLPSTVQDDLFDASQLPLGHELLTLEEDARSGRSTGERLAKDRARYEGIVRCLAEGIGIRRTARAFHASTQTVMAIRDKEGVSIETQKKELSKLMGHFVRISVERLIEEHEEIPIGQLSVSAGIIQDKKTLLDGDATVRVEERIEVALTPADLRGMLERLKGGRVIDVPAETAKVASLDSESTVSPPV